MELLNLLFKGIEVRGKNISAISSEKQIYSGMALIFKSFESNNPLVAFI